LFLDSKKNKILLIFIFLFKKNWKESNGSISGQPDGVTRSDPTRSEHYERILVDLNKFLINLYKFFYYDKVILGNKNNFYCAKIKRKLLIEIRFKIRLNRF
jgi:hypothetical protein